MYLPEEIPNAKILITVKTYPRPTPSHEEIVCTAGILESGEWVRIYPIPFRDLPYDQQFKKFHWIELNLTKSASDFRRESYEPVQMYDEEIRIGHTPIGTKNNWLERKRLVLRDVSSSMIELTTRAYEESQSLATLKPKEIIKFEIVEEENREWESRFTDRLRQMRLFDTTETRKIVKKLPYRYYYHFLTEGDKKSRLMISDWEIGALYWNCLNRCEGDEIAANQLVEQKYMDDFAQKKDLYLFLGTTYQYHVRKASNPFTIIGVFPPPRTAQLSLSI